MFIVEVDDDKTGVVYIEYITSVTDSTVTVPHAE